MYCKYCGSQVDNDSQFCSHCGKSISSIPKERVSKPNQEIANKDTINVQIIKQKTNVEEKAKNTIKFLLRQIGLILLFFVIALIIGLSVHSIQMQSPIPNVSEEAQKNFNNEIFKLENPNGVPSLEELKANNFKRDYNKYPYNGTYSFGLPAAQYLQLGSFKYDDEISSMSQLEKITETRQYFLEKHAEENAKITFWIIFFSILGIYYMFLFIKWLNSKK